MLLPLNWLKQFVKIDQTAEQIAEKLTLSGSEVEKITRHDVGLSKVYVGQIKEIKPHPNADKLRLTYVDVGKGKLLEIVCGGNNIAVGQKVPVVLSGGSVPGMKIELREIRGVRSQGMLAGYDELIESDDHSGIFILPVESKIGADVVKLLELDEPVLELEITPNRADCFSVRGLAREVAALYGLQLKAYRLKLKESSKSASSVLSVAVKDKELCPKYLARVVENVTIKPSPLWLQNKLRQAGIKSINNIVDVTNYVMMELGQPLHAFDADLLSLPPNPPSGRGGEIRLVVRRAKKGEKILALDENIYELDGNMLVIADSKKPVAIAGVMGGQDTAVHAATRRIILESAIFDSVSVRKTSRVLGLRSESSMRFEKGLDPMATEEAINLAAKMIGDLAGGAILKGIVFVETHRMRLSPAPVKISTAEITRLLGVEIKAQKIKAILQSLGFGVAGAGRTTPGPSLVKEGINIKVPSWRADVTQAADIVEEIGRMLDYNALPKTLPVAGLQSLAESISHQSRRQLRKILTSAGYSEILTYSFYDEKLLALSGVPESEHIIVANPVNAENKYLRANLLPALLSKLSQNSALLAREKFQLFEIGKIFSRQVGESWQAAVGLIDTTATNEELYRRLRGVLESFANQEAGRIYVYGKGAVPGLRFRSAAAVLLINLDNLSVAPADRIKFKPLPFYPVVERDLAMVVADGVEYKQIEEAIKKHGPLLKAVALFDVYHGLALHKGEGTSLAFRLTFGSTDRTLAAGEVEDIIEKLKSTLKKKFAITFR